MARKLPNRIRTTRNLARLAAALAASAAVTAALPGAAFSDGSQVVRGTVMPQFGFAVASDGTVSTAPSTIPISVTRSHTASGQEIVTIVPLR